MGLKVTQLTTPPRWGALWILGPPPLTSALPRAFDGLFEAPPREARWKTEPLRVRDAAGSQGFKSLMLRAYGLTSPLFLTAPPPQNRKTMREHGTQIMVVPMCECFW